MKKLSDQKPSGLFSRAAGAGVAIAAFALLGLKADGVDAAPKVSIKKNFYEVYASTSQQLKSQMRLHGPEGFWGYTRWYIRWTAGCRVSLKLTYTMPRWANKRSAPKRLRRRWSRMIRKLWLHERGHGRYAILAAREIDRVGCRHGNRILRKLRRQNKLYDRRTRHGRTQGVRLP